MSKEIHPPTLGGLSAEGLELADGAKSIPPEKLLQALWFHQRIRRSSLRLVDGRPLQVLHPGFWNRESGPDFRKAIVRIGDDSPLQGDIEIDLHTAGWTSHHHGTNPNYHGVVLHVVWECTTPRKEPLLELRNQLEDTWQNLAIWHGSQAEHPWPPMARGQCQMPLQALDDTAQAKVLEDAARVRFEARESRLRLKARDVGWDAAFWIYLFRALGYKQNAWPMQRLGELAMTWSDAGSSQGEIEARLLGIAGLLPNELHRECPESQQKHRELWDYWWRERHQWSEVSLPRNVWVLSGIRPANHPQRRLALASRWLADPQFIARLDDWLHEPAEGGAHAAFDLLKALSPGSDPFWCHHWTLRSQREAAFLPFLGAARTADIAVNVLLPWMFARARERGDERACEESRRRYFSWPAAQDNSILRLARHRLLKGDQSKAKLRLAASQQGLMQIVADFCDRSNALCENCPFPEQLRLEHAAILGPPIRGSGRINDNNH